MTWQELYRTGVERLTGQDVPDAALDARLLLEHACGITRSDLLAHGDGECSEAQKESYLEKIAQREQRIPLQQITGRQDFMGLKFLVGEEVLTPRCDTEILVEEVLKELHGGYRILDLCTGSGCILISLLHYSNECVGVGADLSAEALKVARENAGRLIPEENFIFLESDLFQNVEGKFEILVSNPPYIPSGVIESLMPEVQGHEPRMALDGGEDGLYFYREIIKNCPAHLCGGANVYFEIGFDQGEAVTRLMEEAGFCGIRVVKDYAGLDRVVCGVWPAGTGKEEGNV